MHPSRSDVDGQAPADEAADVPPAQPHRFPRVTSFRTRRSTLSAGPAADLGPAVARARQCRPVTRSRAPVVGLDTTAWFGRSAPLILEIGSGTGTSTLAMAQAEPDLDVIAVEVYRKGLAQLLSAIDRTTQTGSPVTNIRLIRGDGVDVLEHMFGTATLTGVRVFFPDPWPKARHHKRRLLQPATVALIADRLRPGGILHAATDHAGYAEHIAEVGDAEPLLRRVEHRSASADIGRAPGHQVRAQSACAAPTSPSWSGRNGHECDRRHAGRDPRRQRPDPRRSPRPRSLRPRGGCCSSGTPPTWTWDWARSSAAARPPRTVPGSTRWAAGCWATPPIWRPLAGDAGDDTDVSLEPEATVFTNIAPGSADVVRPWVEALRNVGFAVFAKPKIDDDSDVDSDMLEHIALRRERRAGSGPGGLG